MTYVARVPAALARWTIAMSLSPADWSPTSDTELIDMAKQLLHQLQLATDELVNFNPIYHYRITII